MAFDVEQEKGVKPGDRVRVTYIPEESFVRAFAVLHAGIPAMTPKCSFPVPPVPTAQWDDTSWAKWCAQSCPCPVHTTYRGTP